MATFVGKNPQSGANTALEEPVHGPCNNSHRKTREEMNVECSVNQSCTIGDIPSKIEEGGCEG